MTIPRLLALPFLAALIGLSSSALGDEKAGLAVGEKVSPYHPLLCNGDSVGQRWCMVCTELGRKNGMIIAFTKEMTEPVKTLVSAIEKSAATKKNLGGIVTLLSTEGKTAAEAEALTGKEVRFLNEAEKTEFAKMKKLAKDLKLKKTNLNTYTADGPPRFKLTKDAALTVIVADANGKVTASLALTKDELTKEKIATVIEKMNAAIQ